MKGVGSGLISRFNLLHLAQPYAALHRALAFVLGFQQFHYLYDDAHTPRRASLSTENHKKLCRKRIFLGGMLSGVLSPVVSIPRSVLEMSFALAFMLKIKKRAHCAVSIIKYCKNGLWMVEHECRFMVVDDH